MTEGVTETTDRARFERLRRRQPRVGDILTTVDNRDIVLKVRHDPQTKTTAVMCHAMVDVERGGWFLTDREIGLTVLVLPDSQGNLRKSPSGDFVLQRVEIIRYSPTGKSLLCEVIV